MSVCNQGRRLLFLGVQQNQISNWSYKFRMFTDIEKDTIASCHIENLPERYNESLIKKTELTMKQNEVVMKGLNL